MARYNPRQERSLKRRSSYRDIKQSFLIICEGENTEPDYFNAFRLTSASVKAVGKGMNTIKLVQEAIIIRNEERRKGHAFDQYWVVFDKDDFSNHDFNEAIRMAESNGFNVAYSNQAFEYWFLLHFNMYRGYIHRNDYEQMLSQQMKVKYSKKDNFTKKSMECCCHISQKPYQEQERYWQSSAVHRHRRLYLQQRYSNLLKS